MLLGSNPIFTIELINTSAGCGGLLLAGVERMALGTNFHMDILFRGARYEFIATVAGHLGLMVSWMDSFSHDLHLLSFSIYHVRPGLALPPVPGVHIIVL